jgi:hypothetical protein
MLDAVANAVAEEGLDALAHTPKPRCSVCAANGLGTLVNPASCAVTLM